MASTGRSRFGNIFRRRSASYDDDVERYRAENAEEIEAFQREALARAGGIRPDFVSDALKAPESGPKQTVEGGISGGAAKGKSDDSRNALRNAESRAADKGSTQGLQARDGESNVSSNFVNSTGKRGETQSKDSNNDDKIQNNGFFKKKAPLVSIIISLIMGGGGMYLSQASVPFLALDKINGLFDTSNISSNIRSGSFFRRMLKNSNQTGYAVTKNRMGTEKFKPTGKMKRKLAKNGITFEKGNMIYKDKNGVTTKMDVSEFKQRLETDSDFKAAYDSGTKTWRTSVAAFKDKIFKKILAKFGLTKNQTAGYDPKEDPDGTKAMKQMSGAVDDATNVRTQSAEDGEIQSRTDVEYDNEGKPVSSNTQVDNDLKQQNIETDDIAETKTTDSVSGKLKSALSKVAGLTSLSCGAKKVLSALSVVLAAYQIAQVIATAQTLFEGIDKARTEDADSSPINAIGKALTLKNTETRVDTTVSISNGEAVNNGYSETTTEARSAVQSEGFSSLFTGNPINSDDESVQSFNPVYASNKAFEDLGQDAANAFGDKIGSGFSTILTFLNDYMGISVASLTSSARQDYVKCIEFETTLGLVSTVIDTVTTVTIVVGLVGAVFTGGASLAASGESAAVKAAWKLLKDTIIGALKAIAVSLAVSVGTKILMNLLTRKIATDFFGEDLGNAVVSGGHALIGKNHRAGGGILANKEGYMASLIYGEQVNRDMAESERLARSPFDYTSAYTFAGQLASTIIPITLQSDSILDSFGNFGSVVKNSIRSFIPGASAASAAEKAEQASRQTEQNCPELNDLGVVADAFCNPYITTDFSTIETDDSKDNDSDPNSAINIIKKVNNLNSNNFEESDMDDTENPTINTSVDMTDGSELAKFVYFCGQRESPFGLPDQNIMGDLDAGTTGNSTVDAALSATFIGGFQDLLTNGNTLANWGWIDGSNCVMGHSTDSGNIGARRVSYDNIKYYNRYVEDQRLAASMGVIDESAVDVALDKYYEEHPIDNTPLGIMSRYSGYTKENIIAIFDATEFYVWLAQYDPTDYYPTPAIHKEAPDYRIEDERMIQDDGILAVIRASFETVYRQRNFATA